MNDEFVAPFERYALERAIYQYLARETNVFPPPSYLAIMAERMAVRLIDESDPDAPILVPADLEESFLPFIWSQYSNDAMTDMVIRSGGRWPASLIGFAAWSSAVATRSYVRTPRLEREAWTRVIRAATRLMVERGIPTWEAFYANQAVVDELIRETVGIEAWVARTVGFVHDLQRTIVVSTDALLTMVNQGWDVPLREFTIEFTQADARAVLGEEVLEATMEDAEELVAIFHVNAVATAARIYGEASLATVGGRLTREAFLLPAS